MRWLGVQIEGQSFLQAFGPHDAIAGRSSVGKENGNEPRPAFQTKHLNPAVISAYILEELPIKYSDTT